MPQPYDFLLARFDDVSTARQARVALLNDGVARRQVRMINHRNHLHDPTLPVFQGRQRRTLVKGTLFGGMLGLIVGASLASTLHISIAVAAIGCAMMVMLLTALASGILGASTANPRLEEWAAHLDEGQAFLLAQIDHQRMTALGIRQTIQAHNGTVVSSRV